MTLPIIDAHAHLDCYKHIEIKPGWLPVTVGYSHYANIKNAAIAKQYNIPYVLGIAPQTAIKEGVEKLDSWVEEIKKHKPNAIGEIGLDFHWAKNSEDVRKEEIVFNRMLELAEEMKLPIVIHSRDAEGKVIDLLKERKFSNGIMMHFFSGTMEEAGKALDLGALISFTPLHSKERKKIINSLALESIVVETDSPYVVRTFYDVERAIDYVAEVKSLDKGVVAARTARNAAGFFNI
ncbi:MAG: TatD family hydrolase [Candidatus ainarchaeum sp.]|nr:TatD family hydrolase [Candidatus ainarchaeum sp.]